MLPSTLILSAVLITALLGSFKSYSADISAPKNPSISQSVINETDQFRNEVIQFTRKAAEAYLADKLQQATGKLQIAGDWHIVVSIYQDGTVKGTGIGNEKFLNSALQKAVLSALKDQTPQPVSIESLKDTRFLISFKYLLGRSFSIIEYKGTGKELIGDLVPVRMMDRNLVLRQVEAAKKYLLQTMHPERHGFPKKYDALRDEYENRLRTIYSASSLYTLLKIYDFDKDPEIEEHIRPIADFLLFMQRREGENIGAFYYSYYPDTREKEPRFVVGTVSKTIFTLLELYRRLHDSKYLESAKLAGDWLLTMLSPDGSVLPIATFKDGKWLYKKKESLLYTGQVLSALSRLHQVTGDKPYYEGAERIAKRFIEKVKQEGTFLGDDFRRRNSISTSWVAMALLDYAKINSEEAYQTILFQCIDEVLARQIDEPADIYNYGRFNDNRTTSGNGWVNEVMVEVYKLCRDEKKEGCEKYKDSIVRSSRWLIQNTYSEENTYIVKNPTRAIGGSMFFSEEAVRTDAVCHGGNSLVGLLEITSNGVLISIPERPFEEQFNQIGLRAALTR